MAMFFQLSTKQLKFNTYTEIVHYLNHCNLTHKDKILLAKQALKNLDSPIYDVVLKTYYTKELKKFIVHEREKTVSTSRK